MVGSEINDFSDHQGDHQAEGGVREHPFTPPSLLQAYTSKTLNIKTPSTIAVLLCRIKRGLGMAP